MILDQFGRQIVTRVAGFVSSPPMSKKAEIEGGDCHAVGFSVAVDPDWEPGTEIAESLDALFSRPPFPVVK